MFTNFILNSFYQFLFPILLLLNRIAVPGLPFPYHRPMNPINPINPINPMNPMNPINPITIIEHTENFKRQFLIKMHYTTIIQYPTIIQCAIVIQYIPT